MRRAQWTTVLCLLCVSLLAPLCSCSLPEEGTGLIVMERKATTMPTLIPTAAPTTVVAPSAEATATPAPASGMGCIVGQAVTVVNGAGIPGTTYYLAPALGDDDPHPPVMYAGPDREQGHVPGTSGAAGEIDLRDVPPGRYYLAIWAPYDWVLAMASSASEEPLLITIEPDTCTELGQTWFSWP